MATLRDIRKRIAAVKNIAKITSAMKMVAVAKMRRAQNNIIAARPYSDKLSSMISLLAVGSDTTDSPFFENRSTVKNIGVIVVSADRGLCGGFNANIMRTTMNHVRALNNEYPSATVHLILVGKRATDFFGRRDYHIADKFPGVFGKLIFTSAQSIARIAADGFLDGTFDKVQLIGNEFRSIVRQEVMVHDFLPILPPEPTQTSEKYVTDYIYEPSKDEILHNLLPKHLNTQVWRALLESNAAEQAARMMAMENATRNAQELNRSLTLKYNNLRQAAITKEILEVVGGAEALNK